jgi:hypothetical protein
MMPVAARHRTKRNAGVATGRAVIFAGGQNSRFFASLRMTIRKEHSKANGQESMAKSEHDITDKDAVRRAKL